MHAKLERMLVVYIPFFIAIHTQFWYFYFLQYNTVMTTAHTKNNTVSNIHIEKDMMMYAILYFIANLV